MRTIMPVTWHKAWARLKASTPLTCKASRQLRARRAFAAFNLTRVVVLGENWNSY